MRIVIAVLAVCQLRAQDYLIVPGVRVGAVKADSTAQSLRASLGVEAKPAQIHSPEGEIEPGLLLYPADPTRRLEVLFRGAAQTAAHVWICRGAASGPGCRWRTATGVGMGTTLKELERLNGKPFEMMGCCFDYGGSVVSFGGGKLSAFEGGLRLFLGLSIDELPPRQRDAVSGDKVIRSSLPLLRKLNPRVHAMRLDFPERP